MGSRGISRRWYWLVVVAFAIIALLVVYSDMNYEYITPEQRYPNNKIEGNINTLYNYYKNITRYPVKDYAVYVFEPNDDQLLSEMYPNETIESTIEIMKSITYTKEEKEYPKFPIETIVEGKGDCEDIAILGASILVLNGYTPSLIVDEGHMLIKVDDKFFDAYGFNEAHGYTEYTIEDRPLFFHNWGEIVRFYRYETIPFIEGEIIVENKGPVQGTVGLDISGEQRILTIEAYSYVSVKFRIREENLVTKLLYQGEVIDEIQTNY